MMDLVFRKALDKDFELIWNIISDAKESRRLDGSTQWQDGYPNRDSITNDLFMSYGYVLCEGEEVLGYAALIFDIEPAYEQIIGTWLTEDTYCVIHRVAVAKDWKGRGMAYEIFKQAEIITVQKGVFSIKVDTNFDNIPMLKIMDKLGYEYCGKVYFRGGERLAYEKILC